MALSVAAESLGEFLDEESFDDADVDVVAASSPQAETPARHAKAIRETDRTRRRDVSRMD